MEEAVRNHLLRPALTQGTGGEDCQSVLHAPVLAEVYGATDVQPEPVRLSVQIRDHVRHGLTVALRVDVGVGVPLPHGRT